MIKQLLWYLYFLRNGFLFLVPGFSLLLNAVFSEVTVTMRDFPFLLLFVPLLGGVLQFQGLLTTLTIMAQGSWKVQ